MFHQYRHILERFYFNLLNKLVKYVPIENLHATKKIIYKLYFSHLHFRVWNHMFPCCRSQYESNMCLFCNKVYFRNKKICDAVEKKLTIKVLDYFPVKLSYGVIIDGSVNFFVHCSISDREKTVRFKWQFWYTYYEVISSPFSLWKFYLDNLARIVFNYCDKDIVLVLLSGIEIDKCRNFTVVLG